MISKKLQFKSVIITLLTIITIFCLISCNDVYESSSSESLSNQDTDTASNGSTSEENSEVDSSESESSEESSDESSSDEHKDVPPDPPVVDEEELTLFSNNTTDYVIIYDGSDSSVATLVKNMAKYIQVELDIDIKYYTSSIAKEPHKHEIIIGNIRSNSQKIADMVDSVNDFGIYISEDDLVLYASDAKMYQYLFEYFENTFLKNTVDGNLVFKNNDNFIYQSSSISTVNYVEYLKNVYGKLTMEHIYSILERRSYTLKSTETVQGVKIPYRIYTPYGYDENKEYPVVVFLHGAGERGTDNTSQLKNMVQNMYNLENTPFAEAIVIFPQCPTNNQWVDTPWSNGNYSTENVPKSNELIAVVEILNNIKEEYSTDENRYYAMGVSMGGFGTWDLIMRHPEMFDAALALCGGADVSKADVLVNMPIYAVHSNDDWTVPCSGTRDMVQALKDAGSTVIVYEELTGYGHYIWDYVSTNSDIINWLFSQSSIEDKR